MNLEQDEIERRSQSISMQKAVVASYTFSWPLALYQLRSLEDLSL